MKNRILLAALLAASCVIGAGASSVPITITVTPASAPNVFGSPSWSTWVDNSITAQYLGVSSYGNSLLPSFYSAAPATMSVSQNVVTGFASWSGNADPGTTFGAAFANELGNRIQFGVDITGAGTLISIDKLGFSAVSTDPMNTLGFSFATGTYGYSSSYRGLLYGPDGLRGTSDDVWITSGASNQLVNEIIGRGSGNAWPVYLSDPGLTNQARIDGVNSLFSLGATSFDFVGTYTYDYSSTEVQTGSGNVRFAGVPDGGATAFMLISGVMGLMLMNSRQLRRKSN